MRKMFGSSKKDILLSMPCAAWLVLLASLLVLLTGCSPSATQGAKVGGLTGGAAGLGAGIVRGDAIENMAAGALAGAMGGATAGYIKDQQSGSGQQSVPNSLGAGTVSNQSTDINDGTTLLDAEDGASSSVDRQQRLEQLVAQANKNTASGAYENSYQYRIGSQDLIEVKVFQAEELNHVTRVDSEGYASLPLLGQQKLGGLTVDEAENLIEKGLAESYLQNPSVTVFIKEYESQKITLEGWVKDPGVYPMKGKTTLLQAIALADGLDRLADGEEVAIFRRVEDGKIAGYVVNLHEVRSGVARDPVLSPNDVVVVPKHGGMAALDEVTKTLRGFIGFGTVGL